MTQVEVDVLARILMTADGNCTGCAGDLVGRAQRAFPALDWLTPAMSALAESGNDTQSENFPERVERAIAQLDYQEKHQED